MGRKNKYARYESSENRVYIEIPAALISRKDFAIGIFSFLIMFMLFLSLLINGIVQVEDIKSFFKLLPGALVLTLLFTPFLL
ncbi:MAG: hypothetical protein ACFFCS_22805, partial [Candidatus Hodarchaeota archaeon]